MSSPPDSPRSADLVPTAADAAGEDAPMAASKPAAGGRKKPAVPFGRVWSEADEFRILNVLVQYVAIHDKPPERSELCATFKDRGLDKAKFTVTEIYEKVRRLRDKYLKLRDAGGPPALTSGEGACDDEVRKYELSKAIWRDQRANVPRKKRGSTSAAAVPAPPAIPGVRRGFEDLQGLFPCLAAEVDNLTNDEMLAPVLKRAFESIDDQKAGKLNNRVKKQIREEAEMAESGAVLRNEVFETLLGSIGTGPRNEVLQLIRSKD